MIDFEKHLQPGSGSGPCRVPIQAHTGDDVIDLSVCCLM